MATDQDPYQVLVDNLHGKQAVIKKIFNDKGAVTWRIVVPDAGDPGMARTLVKLLNEEFWSRQRMEERARSDEEKTDD